MYGFAIMLVQKSGVGARRGMSVDAVWNTGTALSNGIYYVKLLMRRVEIGTSLPALRRHPLSDTLPTL
jgi:hypothetical protein